MHTQALTPVRTFTQRFSSTPRAARLARYSALQQLARWGILYRSEVSDTATAIVAELAANAATHGRVPGRDFELRLALAPTTLRIEVTDTRTDSYPPTEPAPPTPDSESGRGILLVAALATRFGTTPRNPPPGKTIWAEIVLPFTRTAVEGGEAERSSPRPPNHS